MDQFKHCSALKCAIQNRALRRYVTAYASLLLFPALVSAFNPAAKLAFAEGSLSFPIDSCVSSLVLVTNASGVETPVASNSTLEINEGPASLGFYTDLSCTQKASSFALPSGTSSYRFYMRGTAVGTFSFRAEVSGLQSATQTASVSLTAPGAWYQNPPTMPPSQASAAGYSTLVFDDEFNSANTISPNGSGKYNWYTTNFYTASATLPASGYEVANGYLTILTDASGYGQDLSTADPTNTSTVWQHGYFEARIQFNPTGNQGGSWPAFWSYSIEGATGTVAPGSYFGELDFLECYPVGSSCTYITTVHQWEHASAGNTSVAQNPNNVPSVPAGTEFNQWHVYGCLWTPNQIQWYFDNQLVTTVATGPGTNFTAIEQDHLFLILGTGKNWPINVDYVHVWQ